ELDAGKVEDHARLAVGDRVVEALGELRRGRRVDLTLDPQDDGPVVELLFAQVEVGGLEFHPPPTLMHARARKASCSASRSSGSSSASPKRSRKRASR